MEHGRKGGCALTTSAPQSREDPRPLPVAADTSQNRRPLEAAVKLHGYLVANHWSGDRLIGPDPGIRLNYRIGRFIKGYLHRLAWKDDVYFLQAQGYWLLA